MAAGVVVLTVSRLLFYSAIGVVRTDISWFLVSSSFDLVILLLLTTGSLFGNITGFNTVVFTHLWSL